MTESLTGGNLFKERTLKETLHKLARVPGVLCFIYSIPFKKARCKIIGRGAVTGTLGCRFAYRSGESEKGRIDCVSGRGLGRQG